MIRCLAISILLFAVCCTPVPAQDAKPQDQASITKAEAASPQALRARKSVVEADLVQLRSDLAQKKKELEEVRLLELDVIGVGGPSEGLGTSLIEATRRTPETIRDELRARAIAVLSDQSGFGRFNTDKFQTFVAKQMAVRLVQSANKTRSTVPKECDPESFSATPTKTTMDRLIKSCVDAVNAVLEQRKANPAVGPQQDINNLKSTLQADIDGITKKISASEALLREVEGLLANSNDLTEIIIKWTIPSLGAVLILILIAPRLYGADLQSEIFNQKLTLDLLTVYILVSTILILGLANRIQNEVLGTLLGGISGYVLGRSLGARQAAEAKT